jgi:hypothetical protein
MAAIDNMLTNNKSFIVIESYLKLFPPHPTGGLDKSEEQ